MAKFDSMFLKSAFAVGSTKYEDHYEGYQDQNHIVLTLAFPEKNYIRAIVDTGAKWCIINPAYFERFQQYFFSNYDLGKKELPIRGTFYSGEIAHAKVILEALNGKSLEIEGRFFIPRLLPNDEWRYPNFIGLDGLLNCIRFAVDPSENTFYFGA